MYTVMQGESTEGQSSFLEVKLVIPRLLHTDLHVSYTFYQPNR